MIVLDFFHCYYEKLNIFLKYHIISTYYLIYIDIFFILFTLWNSNMKNIYNMVLFFIIQSYINSIYLNFHSYTMINFQYNQIFYYIIISSEKFPVQFKIFYIFSLIIRYNHIFIKIHLKIIWDIFNINLFFIFILIYLIFLNIYHPIYKYIHLFINLFNSY